MRRFVLRSAPVCLVLSGLCFLMAWWVKPDAAGIAAHSMHKSTYYLTYEIEDGGVVTGRAGGGSGTTHMYVAGPFVSYTSRRLPLFGWLWGELSLEATVGWHQDLAVGPRTWPWDLDVIRQIEAIAEREIRDGSFAQRKGQAPWNPERALSFAVPVRVDPWTMRFQEQLPDETITLRPERLVLLGVFTAGVFVFASLALLAGVSGYFVGRTRRRWIAAGMCAGCGYDLADLAVCPECGKTTRP